jgi:hypothetical protein
MPQYLTTDDVSNYGSELVDFAQRAALHSVAPHLQNLEQQNVELQRRLAVRSATKSRCGSRACFTQLPRN